MIKPADYVHIINNIFSYILKSIKIISVPEDNTGIIVKKNSTNEIINKET